MDKETQNATKITMEENLTLQDLNPNTEVEKQNTIEKTVRKNAKLPNLIPIADIRKYNAFDMTMQGNVLFKMYPTVTEEKEISIEPTIHENTKLQNVCSVVEIEEPRPIDITMHDKVTSKNLTPIVKEEEQNVIEATMHENSTVKDTFQNVLVPYSSSSVESLNSELFDSKSDSESERYLECSSSNDACDSSSTSIDNTVDADSNDIILNPSLQTNETFSEPLINLSNQVPVTASSSKNQNKPKTKFIEENNNLMSEELSQNSLPGCSKDSDDKSSKRKNTFSNIDELLKEAKKIHSLLPKFSNSLIYKTLFANQLAENRIELTLWDLLHNEQRPLPLFLGKRKFSDEESLNEYEISLHSKVDKIIMEAKEQHGTCEKIGSVKMRILENKPHELSTSKVNIINQNVPETAALNNAAVLDDTNNNTNQQSLILVKMPKKDMVTQDEPMNIEYEDDVNVSFAPDIRNLKSFASLKDYTYLKERHQPCMKVKSKSNFFEFPTGADNATALPTKFLRPPKFIFENNERSCQNKIYKPSIPILSPSKLLLAKNSIKAPVAVWQLNENAKVVSNANLKHNSPLSRLPNTSRKYKIASRDVSDGCTTSSNNKTISRDMNSCMFRLHSFSPVLPRNMETQNVNPVYTREIESFYNQPSTSATPAQGSSHQVSQNTFVTNNAVQKPSASSSQVSNKEDRKKPIEYHGVIPKNSENANYKKAQINVNTENQKKMDEETIILNEKVKEVYVQLIPMFPTVKTLFIKQLCYEVSKRTEFLNKEVILEHLIDILLNCKQENLKEFKPVEVVNKLNPRYDINEQYADLLMLFPEADPVYLRKIVEEIQGDHAKYNEFVQLKLEKPDYPTREQYLAKKKITEQQRQYTTDFQVEKFLEIFPDPFTHFENEKRICLFNPHAIDFLKYYFSKLKVNTLVKAYGNCMNNLSLTAKTLENLNSDMKTRRSIKMVPTEDIPFLQECAFIQHKMEITKYMNNIKIKEKEEFNKLKANNELLECQCCYDNECMPLKCSTCEDGHIFCNSCIVRSTDIVLGDGNTRVDCLIRCGSEFPISVLQRVLSPTKFSILLCKRQEAEVMAAGVDGLVSCPFCHFASIPPPEDKIFKCFNPECMKESCRLCKELNHIPLKCHEKKTEAARLYLEEKMTEALVRKCYKCSRMFFKEEGCNKMTCVCGAQMCYICDKPVTNYEHFQGQGAGNSNLCPLWSDNRRLNAEGVIKVYEETIKQIKQKDPNVDINVKALLPNLPPKSKGPHDDIVNNAMIYNRIARHFQ